MNSLKSQKHREAKKVVKYNVFMNESEEALIPAGAAILPLILKLSIPES